MQKRLIAAGAISLFVLAARVDYAAAVALETTSGSSEVSVTAKDNSGAATDNPQTVSSLPYLTLISATQGTSTNTVTPAFSEDQFQDSVSGTFIDQNSSVGESTGIYFTTTTITPFTISGSVSGLQGSVVLSLDILNLTSGQYAYYYANSVAGPATLTLDNSFGYALTGTLPADDNYQFFATTSLSSTPTPTAPDSLTGTFGVVFGVPEPGTLALSLLIICPALLRRRRHADKSFCTAR
jgi:hypothetical protein